MASSSTAEGENDSAPAFLKPSTKEEFARCLRALRDRKEASEERAGRTFTPMTIERATGIRRSTYFTYINGKHLPRWKRLDKLLSALDATAAERRVLQEALDDLTFGQEDGSAQAAKDPHVEPAQFPAIRHGLFGRSVQLQALHSQLGPPDDPVSGFLIAVTGSPGVGKTALAVSWADSVKERYPDGQLYIDLRGFDLSDPVRPADALASILQNLGVTDVPADLEGRVARYRTAMSGKKILVVLDNVRDSDHARNLLPGSSGGVIVTSRDSLGGLVAREGAVRVEVNRLEMTHALDLLRSQVGTERVDADIEAAEDLAARCVRLPLALRIAGEIASFRKSESLARLAHELSDERNALDVLEDADDDATALRSVFSWSFKQLSERNAHAFCLIGLNPGTEIDRYGFAALADTEPSDAIQKLRRLHRVNLLEEQRPGRFTMHDLLRIYAREQAEQSIASTERVEVAGRLSDYYLVVAATAVAKLDGSQATEKTDRVSRTPLPPLEDGAAASEWLERERGSLEAISSAIADHQWTDRASQLAAIIANHFRVAAFYKESLAIHTNALRAVRAVNDTKSEAKILDGMSGIHYSQGRLKQSCEVLRIAQDIHQSIDDPTGRASVLIHLGTVLMDLEEPDAESTLNAALTAFRNLNDVRREGAALNNLGILYEHRGRLTDAIAAYEAAYALQPSNEPQTAADPLLNLGIVAGKLGNYQKSIKYFAKAYRAYSSVRYLSRESLCLTNIGEALLRLDHLSWSRVALDESLRIAQESKSDVETGYALIVRAHWHLVVRNFEIGVENATKGLKIVRGSGHAGFECQALTVLGSLLSEVGQIDTAVARLENALELARKHKEIIAQQCALRYLGKCWRNQGDEAAARRCWDEALALNNSQDNEETRATKVLLAETN